MGAVRSSGAGRTRSARTHSAAVGRRCASEVLGGLPDARDHVTQDGVEGLELLSGQIGEDPAGERAVIAEEWICSDIATLMRQIG
jgi:hypothetical protein